jgi:hypothetical protein
VETVSNAASTITWDPPSRVAYVRYTAGAKLTEQDGHFLADSLSSWIGADAIPFAVLADAGGLGGTDGAYRARASKFFKQHRDRGFIALINVGPVIHIVVEMFRIGTGIQLKTFSSEDAARDWLRGKGIAA